MVYLINSKKKNHKSSKCDKVVNGSDIYVVWMIIILLNNFYFGFYAFFSEKNTGVALITRKIQDPSLRGVNLVNIVTWDINVVN